MRRGFAPHFRHLDDLFAPQNLTLCTILFRSCWVPFRSPPFSACRRSFCPQNWPNLSFYSDLVGSHFELRAVHPYWFWPGVPPPRVSAVLWCMTSCPMLHGIMSNEEINNRYHATISSSSVKLQKTVACCYGEYLGDIGFPLHRLFPGLYLSIEYIRKFGFGNIRDSKVHGANMGPNWVLSASDGPHVGPMNLAIRDLLLFSIQLATTWAAPGS